jgi:tetratricopeptide (TPR) repeat protein/CHAT domain-containing protein
VADKNYPDDGMFRSPLFVLLYMVMKQIQMDSARRRSRSLSSGNFRMVTFFAIVILSLLSFKSNGQTLEELNNKVFENYRKEDYKAALKYAEQLVTRAKTELGETEVYTSLVNNLALLYFKTENYESAKTTYIYVMDKQSVGLTLSQADFIVALNNLAVSCKKTYDYENAILYYSLLSEAFKKTGGEDSREYLDCLGEIAYVYRVSGDYENAKAYYLHLLEVYKANSQTDGNYAIALMNLGILYDDMDDYARSLDYYLQAAEVRKTQISETDADYAQLLNNLAFLYFHMGNYAKAEETYLKSMQIRKEVLGEDHYLYASSLNNLAGLYQAMAQYEKAATFFKQALEIRRNTLGENHLLYAGSLNNLAKLYYDIGDYEKAIPTYMKALASYRAIVGENHPDIANLLNNIANLYQDAGGEKQQAESYFLEAIRIQQRVYGSHNLQYVTYLGNLGSLYQTMGDYAKAEKLMLEVLGVRDTLLGKEHPDYALSLNNLGTLYHEWGNPSKAKEYYTTALTIRKKALGNQHPLYVSTLLNLACLASEMKEYRKADTLFRESKNIILNNLKRNFAFLSESEKEKYVATINFQFDLLKNFYLTYRKINPSIAADAYDIELATKGMIRNTGMQMRKTILQSGNTEALQLYDAWVSARAVLAKQYSLPSGKRTFDTEALEDTANALEKKLEVLSASYQRSKDLVTVSWKDVQARLGPMDIAIEFSSIHLNDGKKWIDSTVYVALVLRKTDAAPKMIPLCAASQLSALLNKGKESDGSFISGLYRGSELLTEAAEVANGKKLYTLLWKPLDSLLMKGNNVYFAPAGTFHQLAFAAIPYDAKSLLSDRYVLEQLSTSAMLVRGSGFPSSPPGSMVVYGGITYDVDDHELLAAASKEKATDSYVSRSAAPGGNKNTWSYLPGTLAEARKIQAIALEKKIDVKLFSGTGAVEESFKNTSGNKAPRVIHIATHGFFFANPLPDTGAIGDGGSYHSSEDPLNRAGILFAGASKAWNGEALEGIEDGILTAYEAANITLTNTQLVTLSACETGLGEIKGSEGVYGLQRAFKMAGAEYLLMSLWKVPDAETAEYMLEFYSEWFSGRSIPDAFHGAQNYMKIKYPKEPYKWAAFVLVK